MTNPGGLPIIRVWLQPEHLVSTAKLLLTGHRLPAIGVVGPHRKLVGLATQASLHGAPEDAELSSYLVEAGDPISIYTTVRDAAKLIQDSEHDFLPVIHEGAFQGILSAKSLLGRLRQSFDPMTQLPWSDALRDWGAEQLSLSNEIAIIFVDLNKFGVFNKQFGHVIGDKVLQGVVAALKAAIDPTTDLLVRYGGDEFAIGTLRDRDDADVFVNQLRVLGNDLQVDGVPAPISFSVGIHGGRRSKVRNDIHVQANLDNLVNLASQDCISSKNESGAADEKASLPKTTESTSSEYQTDSTSEQAVENSPLPAGYAIVETVQADEDPNSLTYVVLRSNGGLSVGTSLKMGRSLAESIAIATAKALEKAYPESSITIESLTVTKAGSTELVSMETTVVRDGFQRSVTAEVEANDDLGESVASGVISAYYAE